METNKLHTVLWLLAARVYMASGGSRDAHGADLRCDVTDNLWDGAGTNRDGKVHNEAAASLSGSSSLGGFVNINMYTVQCPSVSRQMTRIHHNWPGRAGSGRSTAVQYRRPPTHTTRCRRYLSNTVVFVAAEYDITAARTAQPENSVRAAAAAASCYWFCRCCSFRGHRATVREMLVA